MTTPEVDTITVPSENNPPRKSKIPVLPKSTRSVPQISRSTHNFPSTPEHSNPRSVATSDKSLPKTATTPTSKSQIRKPHQTPQKAPATPSLSMSRSVSTSQIEGRNTPRMKGKQPVLSYNKLSQENRQLQDELSALRTSLLEVERERGVERSTFKSEIDQLTQSLAESNSSVDQLSQQTRRGSERVSKLVSVMERVGIDPMSGEEVLSENERKQARDAAIEKTRLLTDTLNTQIARYGEMCAEIEEKRLEMFALLSLEDQNKLIQNPSDSDLCVMCNLFEHNLNTSTTPVITEEPVSLL